MSKDRTKSKTEKRIFVKSVRVKLNRDFTKSRVIVDGKELAVSKIEIWQEPPDPVTCKLTLFPHEVVWVETAGKGKAQQEKEE